MTEIPKIAFVFVRHGDTDWTIEHLTSNEEGDISLNEKGVATVSKNVKVLQRYGQLKVVSSPKKRTLETANMLPGMKSGLISVHQGIDARRYGNFSGKEDLAEAVMQAFKDGSLGDELVQLPDDGESVAEFHGRIGRAFREILSDHIGGEKHLVIVSHSEVFESLLMQIPVKPPKGYISRGEAVLFTPPNDDDGVWTLLYLNR